MIRPSDMRHAYGVGSWAVGLGLLAAAGCGRGGAVVAQAPAAAPGPEAPPGVISEPIHVEASGGAPRGAGLPLFEAAGSCKRARPGVGARRLGPVRASSSVALAATGEGSGLRVLAYVADGDEPLLHTVDVAQGRSLGVTALRGAPEQVLVLADGRVAVTLRRAGEVQILEPAAAAEAPLSSLCSVSVPTEPVALAESPDGSTLALTSAWARALTVFDGATLAARFQVELPREPRAVVVSDDGKRAFVAHVVNAVMSVVDLDGDEHRPRRLDLKMRQAVPGADVNKMRSGCQGFSLVSAVDLPRSAAEVAPPQIGEKPPVTVTPKPPTPTSPSPGPLPAPRTRPAGRLFAPFVTVDPGEPTRATSGYGDNRSAVPAEFSAVSVIDASAERPFTRVVAGVVPHGQPAGKAGQAPAAQADCLLPRAAAYFDGSLYVACQGNDALLELDARAVDPARAERRRFHLAAGPSGVAIDSINGVAVALGAFDHKLSLVPLRSGAAPREVALTRPASRSLTAEQERGRVLFHATHDQRISADGRSCASCHPDGREDALTWSTPDGPRQTLMLMGRLPESAPYGWSGTSKTVAEHLHHTFERLSGTGLPDDATQALVAYVNAMARPKEGRPVAWVQGRQQLVEQGRALFTSAETACASCHPGGLSDGHNHAVARKATADRADQFDSPSLRFIGLTAPYFHDGRFATLQQMLESPEHAMGQSLQLSREERLALLAYLESL